MWSQLGPQLVVHTRPDLAMLWNFGGPTTVSVIDESDKGMHHYSDERKNICSMMYNWYGITKDSEIIFILGLNYR